jgi:hypothetical protein
MRTTEKILTLAYGLIPSESVTAAISFARQSFRYPATLNLPAFLLNSLGR